MYAIQFADHTFYRERGGNDWGRCDKEGDATHFDSENEARETIADVLAGFRAWVVEDTGNGVERIEAH